MLVPHAAAHGGLMAKINLTPEDKATLIEAMNNGTEPTPDLLPKLFPGTAEKFDVKRNVSMKMRHAYQ